MTWQIKLAIFLVCLGAGAMGVWAYNDAIKAAVEAKQAADAAKEAADEQKAANDDLKAKVAKMNVILGRKVADDAKFRQRVDEFESRLQRAADKDPEARVWSGAVVPASVRDSVREQPIRGEPNGSTGDAPSPTNKAGATPLRVPNQWGPASAR